MHGIRISLVSIVNNVWEINSQLSPYGFLSSSITCRKVKEFPFLINKEKNPGKTRKRKHLLKIQSEWVIWLFNGSHFSTESRKQESFFKYRINLAIKQKENKKKKRKRGDGKKKKIKKKNLHSPDFYIIFDCIRNFERLKMVACPKTYFFAILRRFANAMPENPLHASGQ